MVIEDLTAGGIDSSGDSEEQLSAPSKRGSFEDSLPTEARAWVENESNQHTTAHAGNSSDSQSVVGTEP